MKNYWYALAILCLSLILVKPVTAQNFKVSEQRDSLIHYLQSAEYKLDPSAPVLVLYEVASTETINGLIIYRYEIAYKVYNAQKIGSLADIVIPKWSGGRIKKLKGVTYNYENDTVVESTIEKSDIIMENYTNSVDLVKFSMPNIKDGSVVSYSYNYVEGALPSSWTFQRTFPVLYSRFNFNVGRRWLHTPYINSTVAFKKYEDLKSMEMAKEDAVYCEQLHNFDNVRMRSWVRRNVPAFKEEALMGNTEPHLERVNLTFNGVLDKGIYIPLAETWDKYNKDVQYKLQFNEAFEKNNFTREVINTLIADKTDSMEMAKAIFYYVQNNIQLNGKKATLNQVFASRQGTDADNSMLLCSMLRNAGFESDLVLISNKNNDPLNELIPNPGAITNIAVRVVINQVSYLMNATQKLLPFGYLPLYDYNGYSRIVNKDGGSIILDPTLAVDASVNTIYISAQKDQPNVYQFKYIREYGVYSASALRASWRSDSVQFRQNMKQHIHKKGTGRGMHIDTVQILHMDDVDQKIRIVAEGTINWGDNTSMIIMDPYFLKIFEENPFKEDLATRKYPVVYDNITQEKYKIYIQTDGQYEFDDYPQSKHIVFGEPLKIGYSNTVTVNPETHTLLLQYQYDNQAISVPVDEIPSLKDFFDDIIKTQNQKVILKKKQ